MVQETVEEREARWKRWHDENVAEAQRLVKKLSELDLVRDELYRDCKEVRRFVGATKYHKEYTKRLERLYERIAHETIEKHNEDQDQRQKKRSV